MMRNTPCLVAMTITIALLGHATSRAELVEAFTEPYRRIAVPAAEVGVIESLPVQEGDTVVASQLLGKLNDSVLKSSLAIAETAMNARGAIETAEIEQKMRKRHLQSYLLLREQGNATKLELARATTELHQAESRLQSVREELEVRQLEYLRVKQQIGQRRIVSPIDGVVIAIDKEAGEFVSPTDPVVLHIVQLDQLKVVFSVPIDVAKGLETGRMVSLMIGYDGMRCKGQVEFISPIANPESNSVRVKVRIENKDRQYPSGVSCRWQITGPRSKSRPKQIKTTRDPPAHNTTQKR